MPKIKLRPDAQPGTPSAGNDPPPIAGRPALAGLIDVAGDPMLLVRHDGALLWANAAACAQFGRNCGDLLSMRLGEIAAGFGSAPLAGRLSRAAAGARPLDGEFVRADGSRWPVRLHAREIACAGETAILVVAGERRESKASDAGRSAAALPGHAGEAALAAISSRLVQATSDDLDAPIRISLAQLSRTLGADSCSMLLLNSAGTSWTCSHHWSAAPDCLRTLPAGTVPVQRLAWAWRQVQQMNSVVVQQVDRIPRAGAADRKTLQAAGLGSALFVPLIHGGEILGCVLLGRASAQAPWHDGEVALVRSVADLFATSIERQRIQVEMSGRLQYESLVGNIASSLLRTPANVLDQGIEAALQRIAAYLRADRAAVVLFSADGRHFGISHEMCAPGAAPARETVQDLPLEAFLPPAGRPWPARYRDCLRREHPARLGRRDAAHSCTVRDRIGAGGAPGDGFGSRWRHHHRSHGARPQLGPAASRASARLCRHHHHDHTAVAHGTGIARIGREILADFSRHARCGRHHGVRQRPHCRGQSRL
ncbi:MAG: GAF domain-containing protein [Sterolibacteriaceae bacterium]|nr:GAF domain-containing protein [Candidatus Methylophosphatis haderslevensis]